MWKMAKYKYVYIHVLKKSLFMCLLKDCESAKSWLAQCNCIVTLSIVIYVDNICIRSETDLKCSRKTLIGNVIVSVLASSAVDRGFESRSGQTKDYQLICVAYNAKHAELRRNRHRSKRFRRPRLYCKFLGVARHESGNRKTISWSKS